MAKIYSLIGDGEEVWLGQRDTGAEELRVYTDEKHVMLLKKFLEKNHNKYVEVRVE